MSKGELNALLGSRILNSEPETYEFAAQLARALPLPVLVLLEGELGSGKTRFVKGLAQGLGIDPDTVTSPTFTLMQEHRGSDGSVLVHVDAYRLNPDDLDDPTIDAVTDRLFEHERPLVAIEWPSRITQQLRSIGFQGVSLHVTLAHAGEQSRSINVRYEYTA